MKFKPFELFKPLALGAATRLLGGAQMKKQISIFCALALLVASSATTYACHVTGVVLCASGAPISGVSIEIAGWDNCGDTVNTSVTTDSTGSYILYLPDCTGSYEACLDTSTLPAGETLVGADCASFSVVVPTAEYATNNWTVNCQASGQPSGCPPCVGPEFGLGPASETTVLELGAAQVSINGPAGGILGDVYIAPGGKANFSGGGEYLTGNVYLGAGATYQNSGLIVQGSVYTDQDLSAQINAAYATYDNAVSAPCTQTIAKLDGQNVTTVTGSVGLNVICVGDVNISGKQVYLTGPAGTQFIIKVSGNFALTGGGNGPQIRAAGGVKPSDILYVFVGSGPSVAFSGGGGGENCCAAIVDGTLLAPYRQIQLSPGLVNGEVISGENISIVSGSGVHCPSCQ